MTAVLLMDLTSVLAKQKSDNLDIEWVYVPKGTCEKITGGVVAADKTRQVTWPL